jgi:hypothetical protein
MRIIIALPLDVDGREKYKLKFRVRRTKLKTNIQGSFPEAPCACGGKD